MDCRCNFCLRRYAEDDVVFEYDDGKTAHLVCHFKDPSEAPPRRLYVHEPTSEATRSMADKLLAYFNDAIGEPDFTPEEQAVLDLLLERGEPRRACVTCGRDFEPGNFAIARSIGHIDQLARANEQTAHAGAWHHFVCAIRAGRLTKGSWTVAACYLDRLTEEERVDHFAMRAEIELALGAEPGEIAMSSKTIEALVRQAGL